MSLCLPVFWLLCVLEVQNLTTNPLLGEEDMPGNLTESLIVRVFRKAVKTACCENRWIINAESSTAFSHSPDGDVNSRRPQACWTYCYTTLKQALRPTLSMPAHADLYSSHFHALNHNIQCHLELIKILFKCCENTS